MNQTYGFTFTLQPPIRRYTYGGESPGLVYTQKMMDQQCGIDHTHREAWGFTYFLLPEVM